MTAAAARLILRAMGSEHDRSRTASPAGTTFEKSRQETSPDQKRARVLVRFMAVVILAFHILPLVIYLSVEGFPGSLGLSCAEIVYHGAAAFTIALGLWSCRAFGWKISVALLSVAWLMPVLFHREKIRDIATAVTIIILALFLRFLQRKDVVKLFSIQARHIFRSRWIVRIPMLTALYLVAGGMVGLVAVIVVLVSLVTLDLRR